MSPAFRVLLPLLFVPLSIQLATAADPEVVYDNSLNDLAFNLDPGTQEVGDEIVLAGTARWLSDFTFEYWGSNTESETAFSGNVAGRLRFYLNNGPAVPGVGGAFAPGTLLFDSGLYDLDPTLRATLTFTNFVTGAALALEGPLPDSFTWSVEFSGLGLTDRAGLTVYSPPTVGDSMEDYWVNEAGNWTLQTNIIDIDFAARVSAVPEPSAVLLALGGLIVCALGGKKLQRAGLQGRK